MRFTKILAPSQRAPQELDLAARPPLIQKGAVVATAGPKLGDQSAVELAKKARQDLLLAQPPPQVVDNTGGYFINGPGQMDRYQGIVTTQHQRIRDLEQLNVGITKDMAQLENINTMVVQDLNKMQQQYQMRLEELENQMDLVNQDKTLSDAQKRHDVAMLEDQISALETKLGQVTQEYQTELETRDQAHAQQIQELTGNYGLVVQNMESNHSAMQTEAQQRIRNMETEIQQIQTNYTMTQRDKENQIYELQRQISSLENAAAEQMIDMQNNASKMVNVVLDQQSSMEQLQQENLQLNQELEEWVNMDQINEAVIETIKDQYQQLEQQYQDLVDRNVGVKQIQQELLPAQQQLIEQVNDGEAMVVEEAILTGREAVQNSGNTIKGHYSILQQLIPGRSKKFKKFFLNQLSKKGLNFKPKFNLTDLELVDLVAGMLDRKTFGRLVNDSIKFMKRKQDPFNPQNKEIITIVDDMETSPQLPEKYDRPSGVSNGSNKRLALEPNAARSVQGEIDSEQRVFRHRKTPV